MHKRKLYLLSIVFLSSVFCGSALAQEQEIRCSTFEINQKLKQENPAYAEAVLRNEKAVSQWIKDHPNYQTRESVVIPVVIHLIYNPDSDTLPLTDRQITSEIDVMNEDYNRENADAYKTPAPFVPVAADCNIRFCLAQRDPNGKPTTGIVRKAIPGLIPYNGDQSMKFTNDGGDDGWPWQNYLNIWVVPLVYPYLGYSSLPDGIKGTGADSYSAYDGCVVHSKAFGRINTLSKTYSLGRTGTHEAGHWLDLYHVWGDDGGLCEDEPGGGSDSVADTPDQATSSYGCFQFPKTDHCSPNSPGIMFMDYMDYSDDSCMNIFTEGQKERMWAVLNTARKSILSSNGCNAPVTAPFDIGISAITRPMMTISTDTLSPIVTLTNYGTETVTSATIYYTANYKSALHSYNWTGSLPPGEGTNVTLPKMTDSLGYQVFEAYTQKPNGQADTNTINDFRTRSYYVNYTPPAPIVNDHFVVYTNDTVLKAGNSMVANLYYRTVTLRFDTLSVNDIKQFMVINSLGEVVLVPDLPPKSYSENELQFNLPVGLSPGLYFIRVIMGNAVMNEKILIMR